MLTGAINSLATKAVDGGSGLLSGSMGDIIVFGGIVAIITIIIGAFFYFVGMAKKR